jgi:hypothetical protein
MLQDGDTDRARQLLREAEADEPNHPVPPLFLGQLALQAGELETARRHLEAAAAKPLPQNWPASHRQRFLALMETARQQLAAPPAISTSIPALP